MHARTFNISSLLLTIIFFLFLFLGGAPTHAQTPKISLESSLQYPGPHTTTTVSISDYSINTVGYDFNWFVDGKPLPNQKNKRFIEVVTGALGTQKTVELRAVSESGISILARTSLIPTITDIIIEADTYTPIFYRGRALPIAQSPLTATVLFMNGSNKTPQSYSYRWTLDGDVVSGGALRGGYRTTIPTRRFQTGYISVEVLDGTGLVVGKNSITIKPTAPKTYLYEINPLRGVIQRALLSDFYLTEGTTDVLAEPYFMNIKNVSDALFTWRLNKKQISNGNTDANRLTLNADGGSGSGVLELQVLSKDLLPQQTLSRLSIFFQ